MAIQVGDKVPEATLRKFTADGMQKVALSGLIAGRKVVMFAVPGAFTPTCHEQHLPGFLENIDAIKAKGVDDVVCVAVNDPFVMAAWEKLAGVDGRVNVLSDGNGDLTRALGLDFDGSGFGLGMRSKRYAMVVEDGIVKTLLVEDIPSKAETSSAASILAAL